MTFGIAPPLDVEEPELSSARATTTRRRAAPRGGPAPMRDWFRSMVGSLRTSRRSSPHSPALPRLGHAPSATPGTDRRWLVVGAGVATHRVLDARSAAIHTNPLAIIDEMEPPAGTRIGGLAVAGPIERLPEIARRLRAEAVLIVADDLSDAAAELAFDLAHGLGLDVHFVEPTAMRTNAIGRTGFDDGELRRAG